MKRESVKLEELIPTIAETVSHGGVFGFSAQGTSMLPTIVGGRDVLIVGAADSLKKHDIILYRRENGQYVLHRIVAIKKSGYVASGDNQVVKESGITPERVIAKLVGIRKGDTLTECDRRWCVRTGRHFAFLRFLRNMKKKLKNTVKLK